METLTHFKKLTNSDYLGVYALDNGNDLIATIASIGVETITGANGKKEDCTVMHFREAIKPMITNITNLKTMAKLFKTPYVEKWVGRQIQIYADYNVRFGGETVEGLRIRPTLPAPTSTKCADCNENIQPVGKASAQQVAEHTQRIYGKPLCEKCATAAKEAKTAIDPLKVNDATE